VREEKKGKSRRLSKILTANSAEYAATQERSRAVLLILLLDGRVTLEGQPRNAVSSTSLRFARRARRRFFDFAALRKKSKTQVLRLRCASLRMTGEGGATKVSGPDQHPSVREWMFPGSAGQGIRGLILLRAREAMAGNGGSMSVRRQSAAKRPLRTIKPKGKKSGTKSAPPSRSKPKVRGTTRKPNAAGKPEAKAAERRQRSGAAGNSIAGKAVVDAQEAVERAPEEEGACTEQLEKAAAAAVQQNWQKLSAVLLAKAKKGNMGSFKLLMTLAERRKPREKPVKKPHGLTPAHRLALEPPWRPEKAGEGGKEKAISAKREDPPRD
jgi:hypothetical protein